MNFPNFRRCRVAEQPEPDLVRSEPAPSLAAESLVERAAAAAPLSGVSASRRDDALWRAAAFADIFGAGGFCVVERAGWWSVTAPELEVLARRCKVSFRLQGGSSPLDPPLFVIGGVEVGSLVELGALVRPMVALAELREQLSAAGADLGPVEVSASGVSMRVNGTPVSIDPDGSVRATLSRSRSTKVRSAPELVEVVS